MQNMQHLGLTSSPASVIALVVLLVVMLMTYKALNGPLSHLPGPLTSKWTRLRLKVSILTGERVHYIHALHEKYGPIVRISPQELSVADIAASQALYKVGGSYAKTDFYNTFTGKTSAKPMFAETDSYKHSHLRRLTASNYSERWVSQMEPHILKNVTLAIERMSQEMASLGYCDVFKWFTFMATDVIGEASFGESFRMLETGKTNQYTEDICTTSRASVIRSEFPRLLQVIRYLPIKPIKELIEIARRMDRYGEESVHRYWKQLRADPDNIKPTLLTKEYALVEKGEMSEAQIRVDARGNIVAGTDTTATIATYAVNFLASHREIEQALIKEVATLPPGFVDEDLRSLKLLSSVIKETLRLRAPVAQGLPRYVPNGGATFCGYHVPAGTVVGIQAYTMHRKPEVWKDPEQFDPSRWDEPTKEMQHSFLSFGGGSRICIGMHFAHLELRHALASFYRTFNRGVKMAYVEGFTDDDLLPMGFFLSLPKGKRCYIEAREK